MNIPKFFVLFLYMFFIQKDYSTATISNKKGFLHMVHVNIKYNTENDMVCGGTIVDEDTVLTAAHCLINPYINSSDSKYNERVYVKDITVFSNSGEKNEKKYSVIRVEVHEDYDASTTPPLNDIAYLIINGKFSDREFKAIKLIEKQIQDNSSCSIYRWNTFSNKKIEILPASTVIILSQNLCKNNYFVKYISENAGQLIDIKNKMLCGYMKIDSSNTPCQDYSGGPLVCKTNDENYIAGIASFGADCFLAKIYPSVFTNVWYYRQWINDIIKYSAVNKNKFPYMVLVKNKNVVCTGIIIEKQDRIIKVLAAAHCLRNQTNGVFYERSGDISVLAGNVIEWKTKKYSTKRVIFHKKYDPSKNPPLNDIALIEIDILTNDYIYQNLHESKVFIGKVQNYTNCKIVGWKKTTIHNGELMHQLHYSTLKIFENYECSATIQTFTNEMFCAERVCEDYSSGFLVCQGNREDLLVGISTAYFGKCTGINSHSIFTNITYYEKWIKDPFYDPDSDQTTTDLANATTCRCDECTSIPDLKIPSQVAFALFIGFFIILISVGILAIFDGFSHFLRKCKRGKQ